MGREFSQRQRNTVESSGRADGVIFLSGQEGDRAEVIDLSDLVIIMPVLGSLDPDPLIL